MLTLGLSLGLTALLVLRIAAQTQVDPRSIDEIYAAAQQETGPLNVVLGGSAVSAGTSIRTQWNATFPKVALNLTVDLSKYLDSRIDRAFLEGTSHADVAFLQTLHDFNRWKREKRLLHYKPPNFDDVNNALKDVDGAFFAAQIFQFGPFYYDATRVPADRVPKNYQDILDPFWKGKMTIQWPNDDDGVLYLFSLIIQRYGFEWLDSLLAQDLFFIRGAAGPAYTIAGALPFNSSAANGRVLTFTTLGFSPDPARLTKVFPEFPEQFMSWGQTSAIFADTPRPESSKLFQAFLLSDAFQNGLVGTTNPGVRNSLVMGPAQDIFHQNNTQITGYKDFMIDRAYVERWRFQMEERIGLPVGPTPASVFTTP